MSWIGMQEWGLARLDVLTPRLGRRSRLAPHLATGLLGERDALFYLRRHGCTVVARRWTSPKARGDVDLIAWDGDWLCFIEVKTRTQRDITPAESAVDEDKRENMRRLARIYLHSFPEKERTSIPVRFDVISVYRVSGRTEVEIFRRAFPWR